MNPLEVLSSFTVWSLSLIHIVFNEKCNKIWRHFIQFDIDSEIWRKFSWEANYITSCLFYSFSTWPSKCGATAERRTRHRDVQDRNSLVLSGFPLRQGNKSALLGGPVRWECSFGRFLTTVRPWARPPLKCKNEYLVLTLGKEIAIQALVGFIVWAFEPGSRSQSVGRWKPAATRFIAFDPNFHILRCRNSRRSRQI